MAKSWGRLMDYLNGAEDVVEVSWADLDEMVGGLPRSATDQRVWWSGDRPHVRAWRAAGFEVTDVEPGRKVTFTRGSGQRNRVPKAAVQPKPVAKVHPVTSPSDAPDVLLVSCVKSKRSRPTAAKDLYTSALFKKERAYAERIGSPWFILSAEHGLVAPDEWLAPYERYLPDTSAAYRSAWGRWVAARLELLVGPLVGKTIEIHTGSIYLDTVRPELEALGAEVLDPLQGLPMGERLAWYGSSAGVASADPIAEVETGPVLAQMLDRSSALSPTDFLAVDGVGLDRPGLYSWWVDDHGAADLTHGLGLDIAPCLIYAGLAGATRWPSGQRSGNTLWARITQMHLGGNHAFSTFRRTLGAILANAEGRTDVDEATLSQWIREHLHMVAVPYDDADTLGRLERDVLVELDPPLNLQGMQATPVRTRLRELRRIVS